MSDGERKTLAAIGHKLGYFIVETTIMRTLKLHGPDDAHRTLDTCLKQTKAAGILSTTSRHTRPGHGSTSVQSALVEPPGACVRQWRDFHISLRTALSIGIVAVLALTAAIVHVPWSVISRTNIIDLNTRLNLRVIESIGGRIDALLDGAVAVRDALAMALSEDMLDVDDKRKRASLLLSSLLTQPGVTSIELALPDNRSTSVRRAIDGTIRVEETVAGTPTGSRQLDIYKVRETGELRLEASQDGPSEYRPTEQFWYFTAFDKDRPTWSNIFKLPTTGQFGVSTTRAITRDGVLLGVIGVTISLDHISGFLDGIDISLGSAVFLTNNFGELVAVQARTRLAPMGTSGSAGLLTLAAVALPAVRTVVKALRDSHVSLSALARPRVFTVYAPEAGGKFFVTLAPLSQMGLIAAVVIPEADVLGTINRNIQLLLLALAGFIVVVVTAAMILSRRTIGTPLARITENLRQLEDFRLDRIILIPSRLAELHQVSMATLRMSASLGSFEKYIPTELVRALFTHGIQAELGGERRTLTILFMDLACFTRMCEQLGEHIIDLLSVYLSEMSEQVQGHGGTIDKYIGDAVMAFWGAPTPTDRHALLACRGALACQARLAHLRADYRGNELPELRARIGLNTGSVLVGNIGSRDRLNYTVIGDPVNVASRLEALNKRYGTEIIIGQDTYEAERDHLLVRPLGRVAVYGKEIGLETYELLGLKDQSSTDMEWLGVYEQGRKAMHGREWDRAIHLFRQVIELRGGRDQVSSLQIERALGFKESPPPPTWDGLVQLDTK